MKIAKLDIRSVTSDTSTTRAASTATSLRVRSNIQAGVGQYQSAAYSTNY